MKAEVTEDNKGAIKKFVQEQRGIAEKFIEDPILIMKKKKPVVGEVILKISLLSTAIKYCLSNDKIVDLEKLLNSAKDYSTTQKREILQDLTEEEITKLKDNIDLKISW